MYYVFDVYNVLYCSMCRIWFTYRVSCICDLLYRNQSEVATAHFKINVDLRKKIVFRGSGVLFDFK